MVETVDGRVVTGILQEETDQKIVIRTTNDSVSLETDQIAARKLMARSLMPTGVLRQLSNSDIQDLFSYLMSRTKLEPSPHSEKPRSRLQ